MKIPKYLKTSLPEQPEIPELPEYLIFFFSKKYLNVIGEENLQQNELRYKSIIDAFGASKEVKAGGLEKNFIENFI